MSLKTDSSTIEIGTTAAVLSIRPGKKGLTRILPPSIRKRLSRSTRIGLELEFRYTILIKSTRIALSSNPISQIKISICMQSQMVTALSVI